MITINCAGVPESLLESELFGHTRGSFTDAHRDRRGLLEMADGGTVLLDEVGDMSMRMQTLLLRFLESGEIQRIGSDQYHTTVDVRVIAATNHDLYERTQQKLFREDLYYRLNVVHLVMPPLRARPEDIKLLFEHFLRVMAERYKVAVCMVSPEALAILEGYGWPGNVRELKNVAERVAVRYAGRLLTAAELPPRITNPQATVLNAAGVQVPTPVDVCYDRMTREGESFWTVVFAPFMSRDLTRETVRADRPPRTRGDEGQLPAGGAVVQSAADRLQAVPQLPAEARVPRPVPELPIDHADGRPPDARVGRRREGRIRRSDSATLPSSPAAAVSADVPA